MDMIGWALGSTRGKEESTRDAIFNTKYLVRYRVG